MDKNRKKLMSAFMIMLVIAALAVAGYYIINKQITQKAQDEVNLPDTEVGKLLAKDLDVAYPETPTEVVKLYWRLNQCMYNESMDDKEFEGLLKQLRKLYDQECAALLTNTLMKKGTDRVKLYEKFMCRKDSSGKWKILGWSSAAKEGKKYFEN